MAAVTSTYARAFADVVLHDKLDAGKAVQELRVIEATLAESVELRRVWENPSIPAEQKRGLLDAIVAREGLSKPVRNFVAVLIDHRRIPFLTDMVEQFEREINDRLGFAEAQITSARELSDPERNTLEAQIGKLIGKRVKAHYQRDSSLLGGAVVRVGSTIYDGSVIGQLQRVREKIAGSA
ncbi:MAG TPA: ATP synthase F1 subunit delta [Terriglobales bacterium]|nr:ATP synthase F1 subunit delta [Terriglobales bacterium]